MEPGGDFQIALFAALVSQLGRTQKHWLATQLAQMLTLRLTSDKKLGINHSPDEARAIAARVMKDLGRSHGPIRQRSRSIASPVKTADPTVDAEHKVVEAAKSAIRETFESWHALQPGGHWHSGFARIMARRHGCIGQQETIKEWARQWEKEGPSTVAIPRSQ